MKHYNISSSYEYNDSSHLAYHFELLQKLNDILSALDDRLTKKKSLFDLGCGNGSIANYLTNKGWNVTGVDPSDSAIHYANLNFPKIKLFKGSTGENLASRFGTFSILISLEVIEHVYAPREYMTNIFNLLEPGGVAIISTPYHGYLKNLLISLIGKMDNHFNVLADCGHIKFWSIRTMNQLLNEFKFQSIEFSRVGRIHPLIAKSMIVKFNKPLK
jgi:2-polyprenyl-6-hydroxyphenyl methylase/3-demethylubiquinone-9 3-methyltransferase